MSPGDREAVRVRDSADGVVEIEVLAPSVSEESDLDSVCQLIEGVSHFVYVADRARRNLPATQLELELQAEIDKYVLLVLQRERLTPAWRAPSMRTLRARQVLARGGNRRGRSVSSGQ